MAKDRVAMAGEQETKPGLHPRNRHRSRYDFEQLIASCPELAPFVRRNPYQDLSIDFADPLAVKALNQALLWHFYGISQWDVPDGYLCPPVPGRADYIHHAADLLGSCNGGTVPRGEAVQVLDIGVGANCIYPIIGHSEYGWRFLGSDIDPAALAAANRILQANPALAGSVQLRLQTVPGRIFEGLLRTGERFDLVICNPPFHASLAQAQEGTRRKLHNLGKNELGKNKLAKDLPPREAGRRSPVLNFGGHGGELWCPGGEGGFVARMIAESARMARTCLWYSSLVSKAANLPGIQRALATAGALDVRTLDMAQGQKRSRIVAWTFHTGLQRAAWRARAWQR